MLPALVGHVLQTSATPTRIILNASHGTIRFSLALGGGWKINKAADARVPSPFSAQVVLSTKDPVRDLITISAGPRKGDRGDIVHRSNLNFQSHGLAWHLYQRNDTVTRESWITGHAVTASAIYSVLGRCAGTSSENSSQAALVIIRSIEPGG